MFIGHPTKGVSARPLLPEAGLGGVAFPVPFLAPPSLASSVRPSIHHHLPLPLLAAGLGEGELIWQLSLKLFPSSAVWAEESTFLGKGIREQEPNPVWVVAVWVVAWGREQ